MAALTPVAQTVAGTPKQTRYPLGNMVVVAFRITPSGAAADDFVSAANTGLSWVEAVLGVTPVSGTAGVADAPIVRKNTLSNGSAEGSTPGAIAFETLTTTNTYEIVLLGKV
jgi:hypothetical protein